MTTVVNKEGIVSETHLFEPRNCTHPIAILMEVDAEGGSRSGSSVETPALGWQSARRTGRAGSRGGVGVFFDREGNVDAGASASWWGSAPGGREHAWG